MNYKKSLLKKLLLVLYHKNKIVKLENSKLVVENQIIQPN